MEQLKVQFNRQIGPFKLWQWLLVVVAGLTLGLMVSRRFRGGSSSASTLGQTSDLAQLPATEGAPTIVQQDFRSVTALQEQQDRFQDELDKLTGGIDEAFTSITQRIDAIKIPVEGKTPSAPTTPKPSTPTTSNNLTKYRTQVINAYKAEGVDPPNPSAVDRIANELKAGRTVASLRKSIRNNEKQQGRNTVAESKAYWSKRTDKAGSPGV